MECSSKSFCNVGRVGNCLSSGRFDVVQLQDVRYIQRYVRSLYREICKFFGYTLRLYLRSVTSRLASVLHLRTKVVLIVAVYSVCVLVCGRIRWGWLLCCGSVDDGWCAYRRGPIESVSLSPRLERLIDRDILYHSPQRNVTLGVVLECRMSDVCRRSRHETLVLFTGDGL